MNWRWTLLVASDMNKAEKKQHLFDNPRNVSWLLRGFYALFGFVACVTLVLIAKQMRKILKRKADYYDVDD
jgi:hypothetical protein